tara:strand:+ start:45 stop:773 length:729 start_codon:yes stop_codon:yes gene_type:complete
LKRFKSLYALGCSFVEGTCMDEREEVKIPNIDEYKLKYRFSKLLSDKLELKEINNSVGGFSNHRIYRTAYDWIINQPPQTIKETLFIIGITAIDRTDLQLHDGVFRLGGNPCGLDAFNDTIEEVNKVTMSRGLDADDFFDYWDKWFKYIYNEDIRVEETIRDYHLLQTLIKSLGGDIIFLNTFEKGVHFDSRLQGFKPRGKLNSWREFIHAYDSGYRGEHPSIKDHLILSEELYTYIIKNYE